MMRDLRCIMKKVAICLVLLFILIVMVLTFSHNNRKFSVAVLKDYNIYYGDSPRAVASKISDRKGATCLFKSNGLHLRDGSFRYACENELLLFE